MKEILMLEECKFKTKHISHVIKLPKSILKKPSILRNYWIGSTKPKKNIIPIF